MLLDPVPLRNASTRDVDQAVRGLLESHDGREIDKSEGFLLLFDRTAQAVRYATATHDALHALDPPRAARIGIHFGEVVLTSNPSEHVARGAKPIEVDGLPKAIAARIMSVAQPRQTLLSADARETLEAGTEDRVVCHGFWRMKGVAEPQELFEWLGPHAPGSPPPSAKKVHRVVRRGGDWVTVSEVACELPSERDAFSGWSAALRALADTLRQRPRLVTLQGPSGCGKTRFAIHYARTWLGDFPGGVVLRDASAVRRSEELHQVLDSVHGESGDDRLLILDGLEAPPAALRALHPGSDGVTVLVTRRAGPIGLPGETVVSLPPLSIEAATALFWARAQAARADVPRTRADEQAVVALVDALARHPRSLEDAAARARLMAPREVAARMGVAVDVASASGQETGAEARDTTRRAVLLQTDVVDSTKLVERLGTEGAAAWWAAHDALARRLLASLTGREIGKTDGLLLMFDQARTAARYAAAYHAGLAQLDPPALARVGLHVGEVTFTETPRAHVERGAKAQDIEGVARQWVEDVMSLARGGQTLVTPSAAEHLAQGLHPCGTWQFRADLEPMDLWEWCPEGGPRSGPPPETADAWRVRPHRDHWVPERIVAHSLPEEPDRFVGRADDQRALASELRSARLVTVLGMGGAGKTRLAQRFGWTWLGAYPGGVWFCDLAEANDEDDIALAVGRALGVVLASGDVVAQVGQAIARRGRCLVILDNFEQVTAHAASTVGQWLDRAPQARFLVTSRAVLGLPGEVGFTLPPLTEGQAVELFRARATEADPTLHWTEVSWQAVETLVGLLDRLPLAIELAAARVRELSPEALASRIGERFELLAAQGGGRHSTLQATLDWSWDLLSAEQRLGLSQLSVFRGGFTLQAAEAVLQVGDASVIDVMQALVENSLVRASQDRLGMLASVQAYASARLDDAEPSEIRHGQHYATFGTEETRLALSTPDGPRRRRVLQRELDNLVVACRRAVERRDGGPATHTLYAAGWVLETVGPFALLADLSDAVASLFDASSIPVEVQRVRGMALRKVARWEEARDAYASALTCARDRGDVLGEARTRIGLGILRMRRHETDQALEDFEAGARLAQTLGPSAEVWRGRALVWAGKALGWRGDRAGDLDHINEAMAIFRRLGSRLDEAHALLSLAGHADVAGDFQESERLTERAIRLLREAGQREGGGPGAARVGGTPPHPGTQRGGAAVLWGGPRRLPRDRDARRGSTTDPGLGHHAQGGRCRRPGGGHPARGGVRAGRGRGGARPGGGPCQPGSPVPRGGAPCGCRRPVPARPLDWRGHRQPGARGLRSLPDGRARGPARAAPGGGGLARGGRSHGTLRGDHAGADLGHPRRGRPRSRRRRRRLGRPRQGRVLRASGTRGRGARGPARARRAREGPGRGVARQVGTVSGGMLSTPTDRSRHRRLRPPRRAPGGLDRAWAGCGIVHHAMAWEAVR